MPKAKQVQHIRWLRDANTDWELKCPACQRTLGYQPIHVSELRETKFTCMFCGKAGEAVWNRAGQTRLGGAK